MPQRGFAHQPGVGQPKLDYPGILKERETTPTGLRQIPHRSLLAEFSLCGRNPVGVGVGNMALVLKRAAKKARELARQTQTPLVVYRDGKVEKQMIVREEPPS